MPQGSVFTRNCCSWLATAGLEASGCCCWTAASTASVNSATCSGGGRSSCQLSATAATAGSSPSTGHQRVERLQAARRRAGRLRARIFKDGNRHSTRIGHGLDLRDSGRGRVDRHGLGRKSRHMGLRGTGGITRQAGRLGEGDVPETDSGSKLPSYRQMQHSAGFGRRTTEGSTDAVPVRWRSALLRRGTPRSVGFYHFVLSRAATRSAVALSTNVGSP